MATKIDIGIYNYGRLRFLQQNIESIWAKTRTSYNLYIANNRSDEEPEIDRYLLDLLVENKIQGLILIEGNIYTCAVDLLYQHFLKSNPFVITEGDVRLPNIKYCWLNYMRKVLLHTPDMAYLTIRPSMGNVGKTDEEVCLRTGRDKDTTLASMRKGHDTFIRHPKFFNVGLYHYTGCFYQMFNRVFYERYLHSQKRFGWDHMLNRYVKRKGLKWGSLLDNCVHLGWSTIDYYPDYIVKKAQRTNPANPFEPFERSYPGVRYVIFKPDGTFQRKVIQ